MEAVRRFFEQASQDMPLLVVSGAALLLLVLLLIQSHRFVRSRSTAEVLQLELDRTTSALEQAQALTEELPSLRAEKEQLLIKATRLETETEQQRVHHQQQLAQLESAREQLRMQFEETSRKIFAARQQEFSEANQTTLAPLKQQLKEFRERVDTVYDNEQRARASLGQELNQLKELNTRLSKEAQNLTQALKGDSKQQGNWGEVILQRLLERSGLKLGIEYQTQASFTDEAGKRKQPDVVVNLPDERFLVVDAKVSLTAWERYHSSGDQQQLKEHVSSLKRHVKDLSAKNYQELLDGKSPDFVLMFVPIEAAFAAAFSVEPEMMDEAAAKRTIIVCPSTLMTALATVHSLWRLDQQDRNAQKIAESAGKLHDQFARLLESLEEVSKHLRKGQEALDTSFDRLSRGRGNLVGRAINLKALGARTNKALPKTFTAHAEDSASNTHSDQEETKEHE